MEDMKCPKCNKINKVRDACTRVKLHRLDKDRWHKCTSCGYISIIECYHACIEYIDEINLEEPEGFYRYSFEVQVGLLSIGVKSRVTVFGGIEWIYNNRYASLRRILLIHSDTKDWITTPNENLNGKTPGDLIKGGLEEERAALNELVKFMKWKDPRLT